MIKADRVPSTPPLNTSAINKSRRSFFAQAAVIGIAGGALGMTLPLPAPAAAADDDARLLELEQLILEQERQAGQYDEEIYEAFQAWTGEWERLKKQVALGRLELSKDEIWEQLRTYPGSVEHSRLTALQEPHDIEAARLTREMWSILAKTQEGRRAKVNVMLLSIGGDKWRESEEDCDWDVVMARHLIFELLGGQEAKALRDLIGTESCA